jgi:mannose-6-phosphate isomerase-like protein (cupin superfamily)
MTVHEVMRLPAEPSAVAPDGSDARVLLSVPEGASLAHFELGPRDTSVAVRHRTVSEIWYFVAGRGEMWLHSPGQEVGDVVEVTESTCLTIPVGTAFQFRNLGDEPLSAVGVTVPPWPGQDEAVIVGGNPDWIPTVESGL